MPTVFRSMRADESPAAELLLAMEAEMAQLYDGLDLRSDTMPSATATDFAAPGGTLLVGWLDDQPVACGGVKDLHSDGACEIKRMYVTPEARGGTVGRDLLAALEVAAVGLGYRVVRLDTGPRQPGVARMYRAAGYRDIDNFNGNPVATYFGEKLLTDRADTPSG